LFRSVCWIIKVFDGFSNTYAGFHQHTFSLFTMEMVMIKKFDKNTDVLIPGIYVLLESLAIGCVSEPLKVLKVSKTRVYYVGYEGEEKFTYLDRVKYFTDNREAGIALQKLNNKTYMEIAKRVREFEASLIKKKREDIAKLISEFQ